MKIAIAHAHWGLSAERLKEWLEVNGHSVVVHRNPAYIPGKHDLFMNFGWGERVDVEAKKRFENHFAVRRCVDKLLTFQFLGKAGVPTPAYVRHKQDIPKHWDEIVSRQTITGAKNEGIGFHYDIKDVPNGCALYVEGVPSRYEWRIVVFNGEVVGRYHKHRNAEGNWEFNSRDPRGFEKMDADAIKAAKALDISYVGFDVVGKNKNSYHFLEANSAATLTYEVAERIVDFVNSL